jgi:hypothetical protein
MILYKELIPKIITSRIVLTKVSSQAPNKYFFSAVPRANLPSEETHQLRELLYLYVRNIGRKYLHRLGLCIPDFVSFRLLFCITISSLTK